MHWNENLCFYHLFVLVCSHVTAIMPSYPSKPYFIKNGRVIWTRNDSYTRGSLGLCSLEIKYNLTARCRLLTLSLIYLLYKTNDKTYDLT